MLAGTRGKSFVAWLVLLSLLAFCAYAAVNKESAIALTVALRDGATNGFDWLFIYSVSGVLFLAIIIAFLPQANKRIGRDEELPEFSLFAWFAMLFSAGLASGLVYWGAAEPITHFVDNPFNAAADSDAQRTLTAVSITTFHWGLHGWGLYCLVALALGCPWR